MGSAAESFYLHNYFKLAWFQPLTVILRFSFGSQSDKSGDYEFRSNENQLPKDILKGILVELENRRLQTADWQLFKLIYIYYKF